MVKPKKILNEPSNAVEEFISGLLLQYPMRLALLEGHNVVLSRSSLSSSSSKVKLISGGGSGHEPSHAGWLGEGMLSAAVCGGIFASPSVAAILATIRAVSEPSNSSCLVIVKNYTGDRLNFGVASSKANQLHRINTRMVVVADDVALPRTKGITGARGVAGTVLVHKIAGAAAAKGLDLDSVADVARHVASNMGTLGIALDSVTVPGAETKNDRLDDSTIEIGLGIHGEAGLKQSKLLTADEMAREMVKTIHEYGRGVEDNIVPMFSKADQVVLLVNNLGGTSNFEMSILAQACVKLVEGEYGAIVGRVLVGSYMTSFDMHGTSLTILNVQENPEWLDYLDAETDAPAWMSLDTSRPEPPVVPAKVELDDKAASQKLPPLSFESFGPLAKELLLKATSTIAESEPLLTKYDTIVGDGDCGITMKRGAAEVSNRVNNGTINMEHPVDLFHGLADAVSASMGGTSGVLLELMFRKISASLSSSASIGVSELCQAFQSGVDEVSLVGGAQVGSRTMLDALVPVAKSLVATAGNLDEAASAARQGAASTATMKSASAGRSNYLSEEALDGTPDPGAEAVAILFETLAS